jgi:cysteine desulfurase
MVYLDYSATTNTNDEVLDYFIKITKEYGGNPNSNHLLGKKAKSVIDDTTKLISKLLNIKETEIIYTSGSSESNNLAIKGTLLRSNKKHIITTSFEHSSVIAPTNYLQRNNYVVDLVKTDKYGRVDINDLKKLITNDTALISITAVNSEIGIIEPIEEIGKYLKEEHKDIIYHVDLTQLITKKKIDLSNIDLASFSAHKFYGIKGIGCLIKKDNIKIEPIIHGGKSTTNYRSGTPATSLIASLGKALELAMIDMEKKYKYVSELNTYLKDKLSKLDNIHINSNEYCLPHILNFSVVGKNPNEIQEKLSQKEIYISTQTACASGSSISPSVLALTNNEEYAKSSLRVSMSHLTTKEEIDIFIKELSNLVGSDTNETN